MKCPWCNQKLRLAPGKAFKVDDFNYIIGGPEPDEEPYIPNENTVKIPYEEWRKLNMGIDRDPLLVEREKTHGSFTDNANAWMDIREAVHKHATQHNNNRHNLAVEMICLKLARLLQTPNEKDHWRDIAGYAKLGEEACDG